MEIAVSIFPNRHQVSLCYVMKCFSKIDEDAVELSVGNTIDTDVVEAINLSVVDAAMPTV